MLKPPGNPCPHCHGTGLVTPAPDAASIIVAIASVIGSAPFTVAELFALDDAGLKAALAGLTPRQLGKLLRRNIGAVHDGLSWPWRGRTSSR